MSKVESYMIMQIQTDKHKAVCVELNIPVSTTGDAFLDAVLDNQNVFKRSFFMLISRIPPVWIDAAIDRLMSRRPKK